mgnify:CR=1 FL=1
MKTETLRDVMMVELTAITLNLDFMDEELFIKFCMALLKSGSKEEWSLEAAIKALRLLAEHINASRDTDPEEIIERLRTAHRISSVAKQKGMNANMTIDLAGYIFSNPDQAEVVVGKIADHINNMQKSRARWLV